MEPPQSPTDAPPAQAEAREDPVDASSKSKSILPSDPESSAAAASSSHNLQAGQTSDLDRDDNSLSTGTDNSIITPHNDSDLDDEGYGASDASSYLSSILSSVRRGVEENGRIYPSFGKHSYGMPIDEKELDRNDLQHHKFTLLLNDRLYLAPIPETTLSQPTSRILDIGTGTGVWAIDMADKFPSCEVLGSDIAAIQPSFVPPNCIFEIEDIEDDWPYPSAHFDFIHGRDLMTAVRDWPRLMTQAYAALRPGAWMQLANTVPEVCCDDGTLAPDSAYREATIIYFEIAEKMNAPLDAPRLWSAQMRDTGFVDVQDVVLKIPTGPWAKSKRLRSVGALEQIMLVENIEAYMLRGYTQVLGRPAEDLQVLLALAKKEIMAPESHPYVFFHVTFGRKPEVG